MGYLIYQGQQIEFEDRILAHLQALIYYKLRHGECFALSWKNPVSAGNGRTSIWLHPANDLTFHFTGSRPPALNRQWLATLRAEADSQGGLVLGDKTAEPTPVGVPVSGIDQRVP